MSHDTREKLTPTEWREIRRILTGLQLDVLLLKTGLGDDIPYELPEIAGILHIKLKEAEGLVATICMKIGADLYDRLMKHHAKQRLRLAPA